MLLFSSCSRPVIVSPNLTELEKVNQQIGCLKLAMNKKMGPDAQEFCRNLKVD